MTAAQALRSVCDAWEAGDPDAAGMVEGMGAIEDCRVTLDPVIEDGDRVLAIGFFASKLRDGGARFDFPFAILVELRDGRISRLSEYFDTRPLVP
jgi:ketosteroid isomerase-like protein